MRYHPSAESSTRNITAVRTSRRRWKTRTLAGLFAVSVVALPSAIACKGDAGGGPTTTSTAATDQSFVAEICVVGRDFVTAMNKAVMDPETFSNPANATKVLSKPFAALAHDFDATRPPRDLETWKNDTSRTLHDIADKVKKGQDLDGITSSPFPEPPVDKVEELRAIALKNQDCVDSGLTFEAFAATSDRNDGDALSSEDTSA